MVAINLDGDKQKQLEQLALTHGRPVNELARQIIEDYLDLERLSDLSPEEWAEGCLALAPEVFPDEDWEKDASK
jgi:predicted transcriptional regulator